MEPEKDEKYWKDYTEFIKEVENLTEFSPADLLSQYEILIAELNDIEEEDYLEWQYEFDYDLWTRQKIQNVIDHKPISENILLNQFKEKINELDSELKKHILNSDQIDWWNNPKIDFKNGNKASR
ncbi:hypothetical protein [Winogradskyella psychrotolerans]|uniref:hypothetical protein n=1 Tax=Winogradskyella psychrotolerans TaxID=1344585 RepID=UPI001C0707BE|nr:hypothetical protein [Winogradskyella psychrotolerans]MBU2928838.1 hypothetical protein [Winogradskyella psychrotolerans]